MKRAVVFVLAVSLLLCICACDRNKIKESDKSKNVTELVTRLYNADELKEIDSFEGTMDEINEKYPIECIRRINDNNYRVAYWGGEKVTIVFFDDSGEMVTSLTHNTSQNASDFDSVSIGTSLKAMLDRYPDGEYLFLYAGRNDFPRESYHYTIDGYLITILYDEENKVVEINRELI